jgi:hypothetical protein
VYLTLLSYCNSVAEIILKTVKYLLEKIQNYFSKIRFYRYLEANKIRLLLYKLSRVQFAAILHQSAANLPGDKTLPPPEWRTILPSPLQPASPPHLGWERRQGQPPAPPPSTLGQFV